MDKDKLPPEMYWSTQIPKGTRLEMFDFLEQELSASDVLRKASNGLALKGVIKKTNKLPRPCKTVLEPPSGLEHYEPIIRQRVNEVHICSKTDLHKFEHLTATMGFSVDSVIQKEGLRNVDSKQKKEICYRGVYTTVPTTRFVMNARKLRLSPPVVQELKLLQKRISDSVNERDIRSLCQGFFQKYGSHVICGDVHFGGVYRWEAKLRGDQADQGDLVQQTLDSFLVAGDTSTSHVDLKTDCTGGPRHTRSFNLWKLGLEADNTTWSLIQRDSTYTGIWDILLNHAGEFDHVNELCLTLHTAWEKGMLSENQKNQHETLLDCLGLHEYYPSKISIADVMQLEKGDGKTESLIGEVAWNILKRLIMLDYRAFTDEISNCSTKGKNENTEWNPLDVFLTIFSCCDLNLRQVLVQKMQQCRLALPFICPLLSSDALTLSLWPLRGVVLEFKDQGEKTDESSLTNLQPDTVSFLRLGRPNISKSIVMNHILSDQLRDTFVNVESENGNVNKVSADGLIDASFSLPGGRDTDAFKRATMFLNLHGDAVMHKEQVNVLAALSGVVVVCVDVGDLNKNNILHTMRRIQRGAADTIVLLSNREGKSEEATEKAWQKYTTEVTNSQTSKGSSERYMSFQGNKEKNMPKMKHELRLMISDFIGKQGSKGFQWAEAVNAIANKGIHLDESDDKCKKAKELADKVTSLVSGDTAINDYKNLMLPLQGEPWKRWNILLKRKLRPKDKSDHSLYHVGEIELEMKELREQQLKYCKRRTDLMSTFISGLSCSMEGSCSDLYLQWLRLHFDNRSRQTLPKLQYDYTIKLKRYREASQGQSSDKADISRLEHDKTESEKMFQNSVLGVEHLFREMGQIYEASFETDYEEVKNLPIIAAELLLKGETLEVMDGDACGVPKVWMNAVMSSLKDILKERQSKVFTLSVLGIQSSGKTTLLNTMFGLQLPVSAGRCTRGVNLRLVEPKKDSELPFDYLIVLDTEGLRALEIGDSKYDHDNELATFVIGLGDATIINIKGENVAEVKDIIQIAVHAFLRMKMVNGNIQKNRSCIFVHQNVPAVNAAEKMCYGHLKFTESLDQMTREAASLENISVRAFNDVINFDSETHVWYFSDLWQGDPPMAAANPGYHEKVQEVKSFILNDLVQNHKMLFGVSEMESLFQDMWSGVLAEDFVFSFRNSIVLKAYNRVDHQYSKSKWEIEKCVRNWLSSEVSISFENCREEKQIAAQKTTHLNSLQRRIDEAEKKAVTEYETFIDKDDQSEILIQWKADKICSLSSSAHRIKEVAEREIKELAEAQRVSLLHETKLEKHKEDIRVMAKKLAFKMKDEQQMTDIDLWERFENMWFEWIGKISVDDSDSETYIRCEVERILRDQYRNNKPLLEKQTKKGRRFWDKLKPSYLLEMVRGLLRVSPDLQYIERNLRTFLDNLRQTIQKFDSRHAKEVIDEVARAVSFHNSTHSKSIPKDQEIEIAVSVSSYAITVFEELQHVYNETNGVQAHLERYKSTLWTLFVNRVRQTTEETSFAGFIKDQFKQPIESYVQKKIHEAVVEDIVARFYSKNQLIQTILKELAEEENFEDFEIYVTTPKRYALKWLTSYTDKHIKDKRDGRSWYIQLAKKHTHDICGKIEDAVKEASKRIKKSSGDQTLAQWISIFSRKMESLIAVPPEISHHSNEYEVKDYDNLNDFTLRELKTLRNDVLAHFKAEIEQGIKWVNETPYEQVLNAIWGCNEQCPFCKEPCKKSDINHASETDLHECVQHRPQGVGYVTDKHTRKLGIGSCSYYVQSNVTFSCYGTKHQCDNPATTENKGDVYHPFRDYRQFLPHWNIHPSTDMESSHYWLWYLTKYNQKIADYKQKEPADIPESWFDITKEKAIESLSKYA